MEIRKRKEKQESQTKNINVKLNFIPKLWNMTIYYIIIWKG